MKMEDRGRVGLGLEHALLNVLITEFVGLLSLNNGEQTLKF